MKIEIYTDGASRGNPGKAGIGIYIKPNIKRSKYIGIQTNNFAEYSAVVEAHKILEEENIKGEYHFYLDSELVVKQLNGEYKVKNPELKKLFDKIKDKKANYEWIPREKNKIADYLANEAIDKYTN